MFKHKFHWLTKSGVFVGLLGAFFMTYFKSKTAGSAIMDFSNSYGLLIVLATLMYGIAGNILKEHLSELSSSLLTSVAFVVLLFLQGYSVHPNFTSSSLSNTLILPLFFISLFYRSLARFAIYLQ